MRARLLQRAMTLLVGLWGITCQGQAVGYINLTCPAGFSLFSDQLYTTNNDPAIVLDNSSGAFNGWQIMIWTNGSFAKYIGNNGSPNTTNGWLEPNGPFALNPGVGALLYNPGPQTNLLFLGVVPSGNLTNNLNLGLNLVGSIVPWGGGLSSLMSFPNLSNGLLDGDQAFLLYAKGTNYGYTLFTADSLSYHPPSNYGWDGPVGQAEPVLAVGAAFWYRAGNQPVQWIESLSQPAVSPPRVSPSSGHAVGFSSPAIRQDHRFQATLNGQPGASYVIEISPDLKVWTPTATNRISAKSWVYRDPQLATNTARFYRAFILP